MRCTRRGSAYILAVILLATFMALAVALAASANMSGRIGKNLADVHQAQLAAESGMSFAVEVIRSVTVPASTTAENAISNVAAALGDWLDSTANLAGASVTHDEGTVSVPAIDFGGGSFEIRVVRSGDELVLQSRGSANGVTRTVAMNLLLVSSRGRSAFSYGVASMGPITVEGSGEVRGMNELTEANVISATSGPTAITLGGNAIIDGDLTSVGGETSVVITGTPTVAGTQDPDVIAKHIHFGVRAPVFPTVDTSIFKDLTTTVIDKDTDIGGTGLVFENPIIRAGTNPTFSSDVVLNGVVYVEAPNIVTFSAKVTLNGIVATDPADDDPIESCKINFAGQVEAYGVEVLPDLPQYADVKLLAGTFIAAPGFDVSFAGQFTTAGGTIAADKLTFSGQSSGSIEGSIIGLADRSVYIGGRVSVSIDRSGNSVPPGFTLPLSLEVDPRTYREVTGS